jgi:hypothetical protein
MTLSARDDLLHHADDDPTWQESVAVWFFDEETDVGGFFRLGAHLNQAFGRSNLFAFREGVHRYRKIDERVPLEPGSAGSDLVVGTARAGIEGDDVQFAWREPECDADLRFAAFYPRQGFGGRSEDDAHLQHDIYSGHLECSGRLTGTIRLGDETHDVDALCHRDRSWGPRRIDAIHTNRMFTGTVGPALSFALNVIQTVDGTASQVGYVVRDGIVEQLDRFEILPTIRLDGYSVAGGTCRVRLASGEELWFEATTVAGQLTPFDEYLCSDHISRVRCGALSGFCDNELTNNPRLGTAAPKFLLEVDGGTGLRPFPEPGWPDAE